MNIKKKIITSIVLMILLFLYGCGKSDRGYTPTITSKDIYTGKDSLVFEFFDNAPPKEIFENSVLPIGMRLYNRGAHDIEKGYLSIGLEKTYMEIDENSLKFIDRDARVSFDGPERITFGLNGKNIDHPEGEQDVITFTANTKDLGKTDPQSEYHDALIAVTACYEYQTRAVETVCIDTDIYDFKARGEKACEVKTLTLKPQGAPVAVTKIESEMLPDKGDSSKIKPRFMITVKNLGKGEVVKKDKVKAACSSEAVGYKEWNNINVQVYISTMKDEDKLDCDIIKEGTQDDGTLILKQKEDKVRCSYEPGFDEKIGAFSSPLYIILDYGYTDTISREVRIKKINT